MKIYQTNTIKIIKPEALRKPIVEFKIKIDYNVIRVLK